MGRLTWGRVILGGVMGGAWLGLFVGFMLGLLTAPTFGGIIGSIVAGVVGGMIFGVIAAAVSYSATNGNRDFASSTQIVASRYDVLCQAHSAPQAKRLVEQLLSRPEPQA